MEKIRVLIADDHTILCQGLRVLLEAEPDIAVVAEADTGQEAVQLAKKHSPDVIIMDVAMPTLNGVEATRQIVKSVPGAKVLALSSYGDDEYVLKMTELGVAGYLLKQTVAAELIKAIREVRKGNAYFSPVISKRLLEHCREALSGTRPVQERHDQLTSREAEVLQLIAEGRANKQIAGELGISIKTVEKHRQQLMNKLNIHDIAGLTRYAMSKGVIESSAGLRHWDFTAQS